MGRGIPPNNFQTDHREGFVEWRRASLRTHDYLFLQKLFELFRYPGNRNLAQLHPVAAARDHVVLFSPGSIGVGIIQPAMRSSAFAARQVAARYRLSDG